MQIDCVVNTIVRNGEDVIGFCLPSIIPYVKRVIVTVDSRSNDGTLEILRKMQREYPNLEVDIYPIQNPAVDLVQMRNHQLLKNKEKWIWLVDSDEYYPEETLKSIRNILNFDEGEYDTYALKCWAIWNKEKGHKSSSKALIPRIFRREHGLFWKGSFGKEKLYKENVSMCSKISPRFRELPLRYIHLTHIKKDHWRKEMGQERVADGKYLYLLPQEVLKIINLLNQNETKK